MLRCIAKASHYKSKELKQAFSRRVLTILKGRLKRTSKGQHGENGMTPIPKVSYQENLGLFCCLKKTRTTKTKTNVVIYLPVNMFLNVDLGHQKGTYAKGNLTGMSRDPNP